MAPDATSALQRLLSYLQAHSSRITIDGDTHATDLATLYGDLLRRYETSVHYYHGRPLSAEDLVLEMDLSQVDMALTWQNPAATVYTGDLERNAEVLLRANRYIRNASARYPTRFIPAGWTDPKACGVDHAIAIARTCVLEYGFSIVKMNPAQNRFPIDSPDVVRVFENILELGAVPAFHFGADSPFTPAAGLEALALRAPNHPILAVHMGGGGAGYLDAEELYQQTRDLGLRYPNLHFIFSAKRDTHIESDLIAYELAGPPFSQNLFCGSDAPYGRMSWNFGGFRAMFQSLADPRHPDPRARGLFDDAVAARYLGGNLARFVIQAIERVMAKHPRPAAV